MNGTAHFNLGHHKVLYAEDDAMNALLMKAFFGRRQNYELVVADNGLHALQVARELQPALLLLDLNLPDCHGTQLLSLLRELPGCETVPAVAVTADGDFVLAGSGFDELWLKPLVMHHVIDRLDAYLATAPLASGDEVGAGGPRADIHSTSTALPGT